MDREEQLIIVRGGGDIATGTIYKLNRCGFPVLVLEAEQPSAIRRRVAFSEAVYDGKAQVEDMLCFCVSSLEEAWSVMEKGHVALLKDPECRILREAKPWALVDGILAKRNLGTHRGMAPKTIALGPGFTAGEDVDLVIETMRGHNLGRVIEKGTALPNTGVPGKIGGYDRERVVYAPEAGSVHVICEIGDRVEKGQVIAEIVAEEAKSLKVSVSAVGRGVTDGGAADGGVTDGGAAAEAESVSGRNAGSASGRLPVKATISGLVRGMIREGYPVTEGFKMADIDPRLEEYENCFTISDKARCIAGGVLEGLLYLERVQGC